MIFKELLESINNPEELSSWMIKNIRYKNFTKLMTAEEVFEQRAGSCHDQVKFEEKFFSKFKLKYGRLFFIEYNENETSEAMTHTLIYFIKNDKYYWFENSWGNQQGIHGGYDSIRDLKNKIKELHTKMPSYKRYPKLEFRSIPEMKDGITLDKYVNKILNEGSNMIITEQVNTGRKFGCPFCNYKGTREDLVDHVDDEHSDMIPEKFTAARVVFNHINHKDHGSCVICKKETDWNEETWKYDRFCNDKKMNCQEVYVKQFRDRMIGVHGVTTLLNDPEQQKKMMAARSISGEYTFIDGGIKSYVGSYEKNLLEFMDKVMEIPSKDIETPGPIFQYEFGGKTLTWITDIFYVPYNLVFDVKDGGDNKNTHPDMAEYRAKQVAKEKAIANARTHNYIRLTDNRFDQLISMLLQLKKSMLDETLLIRDPIININESMVEDIKSIPIGNTAIIIPYGNGLCIEGFAFSKNILMNEIFIHDDETGKIVVKDKSFLEGKSYDIMQVKSSKTPKIYKEILTTVKEETEVWDISYFPKMFMSGDDITSADQIYFDKTFNLVGYKTTDSDIEDELKKMADTRVEISMNAEFPMLELYTGTVNIIDRIVMDKVNTIKSKYPNIDIRENYKGYFVINTQTGKTSTYYESVDMIPKYILELVKA